MGTQGYFVLFSDHASISEKCVLGIQALLARCLWIYEALGNIQYVISRELFLFAQQQCLLVLGSWQNTEVLMLTFNRVADWCYVAWQRQLGEKRKNAFLKGLMEEIGKLFFLEQMFNMKFLCLCMCVCFFLNKQTKKSYQGGCQYRNNVFVSLNLWFSDFLSSRHSFHGNMYAKGSLYCLPQDFARYIQFWSLSLYWEHGSVMYH